MFVVLVIVALLLIVGVVGFVLFQKKSPVNYLSGDRMMNNQTNSTSDTVPTLSPSTEVDTIGKEIESTTVTSVDADFDEMNSSAGSL